MQAYRIVDWVRRYEVTLKDRKAVPVDRYADELPKLEELRKSPHAYLRIVNTAHKLTTTDRAINEKAFRIGELFEAAVYGLYIRLSLMACNQDRKWRGWILDEDEQRPLTAKDIAELLGYYQIDRVREALGILCDPAVGLIEVCEFRQSSGNFRKLPEQLGLLEVCEFRQTSGNFRKLPEERGSLYNRTEEKINKEKPKEIVKSSVSGSESVYQLQAQAHLEITQILGITKPADVTTLADILQQLGKQAEPALFAEVVEQARQCRSARTPIAAFVSRMKRPEFGYVPGRGGPGGVFSTVLAKLKAMANVKG